MFDEFEPNALNAHKMAAVLELARIASSGDEMSKGGSDHNATDFTLNSCFMFSAILMPHMELQDRSRFAILELDPLPEGTPALDLESADLPAIGAVLARRTIDGCGFRITSTWTRRRSSYSWRSTMAFEGDDVGGADALLGGAAGGGAGGGEAGGAGEAGAAVAEGEGGGGGAAVPDWFERVSAQAGEGETSSNRDWLTAKGVKDLDGLVKMSRDTERALRDSGRIKVPGEGARPEELSAFRQAIGVPEAVDGYAIAGPEGVPLNEPLLGALRESALKHGAPKAAFEGLVSDFIQLQMDEAATEAKRQDDLAAGWLKEQGAKADEQLAHVNVAARSLGLSRTDMAGLRSGLGADRALGLLARLGAGMAEDVLITGGGQPVRRVGGRGAGGAGPVEGGRRVRGEGDEGRDAGADAVGAAEPAGGGVSGGEGIDGT
jgi:hypothetical protein